MSKTAALRKLVRDMMQTVQGETYHKRPSANAAYPYKVFRLSSGSFPHPDRDDLELEVDIWDRNPSQDPKVAEEIADQVEAMFNSTINPQPPLYPAFFREDRYDLEDPDKTLQHIQLRFTVQLHETEE